MPLKVSLSTMVSRVSQTGPLKSPCCGHLPALSWAAANKCSVIIHLTKWTFPYLKKRGQGKETYKTWGEEHPEDYRQQAGGGQSRTDPQRTEGESLGKMLLFTMVTVSLETKGIETKAYWWIIRSALQSPGDPFGELWWKPKTQCIQLKK